MKLVGKWWCIGNTEIFKINQNIITKKKEDKKNSSKGMLFICVMTSILDILKVYCVVGIIFLYV